MTDRPIQDEIHQLVTQNPVLLFMKGTPAVPRCGFSGVVCEVLKRCGVEEYKGIDVLEDAEMREGIKAYTNWPTLPQLYVNGEFVGGADIVKQMYQSGEIQKILEPYTKNRPQA